MKWRERADKRAVEAVIATFCDSAEYAAECLAAVDLHAWEKSYHWLDASGMALYFLDRIQALDLEGKIPSLTLKRLRQNLTDNRMRDSSMFAEFCSLNQAFQAAGVEYANEKGFTLTPESCPNSSLRTQLDFDFLVNRRDLELCREELINAGYVLTQATSTEWKFATGASELARMEDFYKPRPQRSVELHFTCSDADPDTPTRDERLDRLILRAWSNHRFPVLSPADQLIAQALHLLRHLRSPSTRPAWLLEYQWHISARFRDGRFWDEVRELSQAAPEAPLAIGLAMLLCTRLFGGKAPAQLNEWTLERLPASIRLWADLYGRKAVLADVPGTKLHRFLENEMVRGEHSAPIQRPSLAQLYRVTQVCYAAPEDGLRKRLRQNYYQARYILFRLRFHAVEGFRHAIENARWKHHLNNLIPPAPARSTRHDSLLGR